MTKARIAVIVAAAVFAVAGPSTSLLPFLEQDQIFKLRP